MKWLKKIDRREQRYQVREYLHYIFLHYLFFFRVHWLTVQFKLFCHKQFSYKCLFINLFEKLIKIERTLKTGNSRTLITAILTRVKITGSRKEKYKISYTVMIVQETQELFPLILITWIGWSAGKWKLGQFRKPRHLLLFKHTLYD